MKLPAFMFYTGDWMKDPALRSCSLAARGLWIDLLCLMHESDRRGYLQHATGKPVTQEQAARMTGCSTELVSSLLQELEDSGVFSRTKNGTVYSRRMVADEKKRAACSEAGKKGGNPTLKGGLKGDPKGPPKPNPTPSYSSSDSGSSASSAAVSKTPSPSPEAEQASPPSSGAPPVTAADAAAGSSARALCSMLLQAGIPGMKTTTAGVIGKLARSEAHLAWAIERTKDSTPANPVGYLRSLVANEDPPPAWVVNYNRRRLGVAGARDAVAAMAGGSHG